MKKALTTRPLAGLALTIAALTLTGCAATASSTGGPVAGSSPSTTPNATASTSAAPATDEASVSAVLTSAGLQGRSTAEVVAALEASTEDRTKGPAGSVRYDQLVLTSADHKVAMPIPAGQFYLSIAPYVTKTHDCYYHNLATCQGELAGKQVHVTIADAAGTSLVDRDVTLGANGFAGFWLPRDSRATLTVTYEGRTVTQAISTGKGDPTCLTTLKLV
ncbi:CueP family metal-binding protein [Raineyella fluvialis]|uniref:CueP family metal-binding protein n=1 Tax=Raineyella fluvialis TaxID=2662261 RepID=A0A5Q2FEM3_9ACTN|nr:CueP family metal-binding protein [Raineyella fluvialis]QGF23175.1 hypothetical protein Rai3103_05315 [Raineyella fluvialis]